MDLELATLEDIATERSHREVRFALVVVEDTNTPRQEITCFAGGGVDHQDIANLFEAGRQMFQHDHDVTNDWESEWSGIARQRSDGMSTQRKEIRNAVEDRLGNSSYRALRRLSCEVNGDALVLCGRVSTFHEKQLAQEAILGINGVHRVVNQVTEASERSEP